MTKLTYNIGNVNTMGGKEESHAFLETKQTKLPTIMDETKSLNFEKAPYMESAKKVCKKRANIYPLCGLLLAFVFIVWLIGLTMVREFQLADLRREVKELRDAVEDIKMYYENDQLLDEMKEFEAQMKENLGPISKEGNIPSEKVTIKPLPSDSFSYDEDEYHEEDEDDIIGVDFLGEVMEAGRPEASVDTSYEEDDYDGNDESTAVRSRRSFNEEGIVTGESKVNKNESNTRVFNRVTTEMPKAVKVSEQIRNPDHLITSDVDLPRHRRTFIRRPNDYEDAEDIDLEDSRRIARRHRQKSNLRGLEDSSVSSRRLQQEPESPRNIIAAQFHGDTSRHNTGKEYDGNGRLLHQHEVPYTAWSASHWMSPSGMDSHFPLHNGAVTIQESGVYFIYAQIYYHDKHDTSAFRVYRSNGIRDDVILHCVTMTHSKDPVDKTNTCYTAGVFHVTRGDTIYVKNAGGMRYSLMQPGKSFFGFIKLNDFQGR